MILFTSSPDPRIVTVTENVTSLILKPTKKNVG